MKILYQYKVTGVGPQEEKVRSLVGENSYRMFTKKGLLDLLEEHLQHKNLGDHKRYGVYYAYHPDSSFMTMIQEKDGEPVFIKERGEGGAFCAFTSEVIVFTL
ncbi:hypothetical protein IMZ31_19210 (plasmid) [Pontibacillus sp. ALD_SL1]|uniref:hypothetical protein n=1 Tax=Pontibacillus sp. ALD_SL1 TaxID=2777185 RepID=UPI001A956FBE|nr:hypothetical protein [Pontibacillus sp. ALD_SL1]QST02680.1 hypothetical protein IMZ31_19210 [Pontibacillus sp. ALD_SL1]